MVACSVFYPVIFKGVCLLMPLDDYNPVFVVFDFIALTGTDPFLNKRRCPPCIDRISSRDFRTIFEFYLKILLLLVSTKVYCLFRTLVLVRGSNFEL